MKFEIKNRYSGSVIYACELSAEIASKEYSVQLGFAVKAAIKAGASLVEARLVGARLDGASLDGASLDGASLVGANLVGARLVGASLVGASLVGARLVGARLDGASLDGASLDGASLDGASLDGASLVGASLVGARLVGARLDGARLVGAEKLIGARPIFQIGPIGSRCSYFVAYITDQGLRLRAGCFFGSRKEFEQKLESEHAGDIHHDEYLAALAMIDAHAKIWTPKG